MVAPDIHIAAILLLHAAVVDTVSLLPPRLFLCLPRASITASISQVTRYQNDLKWTCLENQERNETEAGRNWGQTESGQDCYLTNKFLQLSKEERSVLPKDFPHLPTIRC